MELNPDFKDLLQAFVDAKVDFLVVGAHAVAVHDRPRATKDLDVWIRATQENAERAWNALAAFGAPMDAFDRTDLTNEDVVIQLGVEPVRIDVLTSISGVEFDQAWPNRLEVEREGLRVPFIGLNELLQNKIAAGRGQDKLDVARLRRRLRRQS